MTGKIPSAETKAWICTADDCSSVQPQLQQILLCVSSEAAFAMGVGLSVGEVEQPSPSNRLYAALL